MAAPAKLPEFQNNVSAVLTEQFWDNELSTAKQKEDKLKNQAKQKAKQDKLSPPQERELMEKMVAEGLTEHERTILKTGISNFEFHYLGSAKILGRIGEGLAESMAQLKKLSR